MFLKQLHLVQFKNYEEQVLEFSNKLNCFVGNNGTGKTNLLDAIYYLSFCKSCFNASDNQNIKHTKDFFAIHGDYFFSEEQPNERVSCIFQQGKNKEMRFNKKSYTRFSEHIGKIPLVIISPYDQDLINGGSDIRRKFLDGVISQIDKDYLELLINYQRVLEQRNKLLRHFGENRFFDETAIQIWDEQLVRFGEPLSEKRVLFLEHFSEHFHRYYQLLAPDCEAVSVVYLESFKKGTFADALVENRRKDAILQYTTIGIHKDDLLFKIEDYPVKKTASQGQQKTFLLALKLAQFEYMKEQRKLKPILLLDDIFDKLDFLRVKQLFNLVASEQLGQVFITDTQQGRVQHMLAEHTVEHKLFQLPFFNDER